MLIQVQVHQEWVEWIIKLKAKSSKPKASYKKEAVSKRQPLSFIRTHRLNTR